MNDRFAVLRTPDWCWTRPRGHTLDMQPVPPLKTKNPPWLRWLIGVLISLPILVILLVLLIVGWRWQLKRDVDRQMASLRVQGIPLNGTELNNFYPAVPDDRNAALMITQAFALMQEFPDERQGEITRWKPPSGRSPLDAEDVRRLSSYVEMNSQATTMGREACKLPGSRYPVDFSPGIDTLMPHLSKLRELARCEYYSVFLNANSDRLEEAAEDVAAVLSLGGTVDAEPTLIAQLVNMAIVAMAETATEYLLNAGTPSPAMLRDLSDGFAKAARTNRLALGFTGEVAMMTPLFRMSWAQFQQFASQTEGAVSVRDEPALIFRVTGFFERDLRFYLSAMQTNIHFAAIAPPGSLEAVALEPGILAEASDHYYFFSSMLLPALSKVFVRDAETTARVRLTQTALSVEQYQLKAGHLPNDIDDLVPGYFVEIPTDPFDGEPLRYRRLDRGYMIYSVGRDGNDDGGREPPPRINSTDTNSYDLTFTVER